jgi:hypothetical protein
LTARLLIAVTTAAGCAGSQFDPAVVDAFLATMRDAVPVGID